MTAAHFVAHLTRMPVLLGVACVLAATACGDGDSRADSSALPVDSPTGAVAPVSVDSAFPADTAVTTPPARRDSATARPAPARPATRTPGRLTPNAPAQDTRPSQLPPSQAPRLPVQADTPAAQQPQPAQPPPTTTTTPPATQATPSPAAPPQERALPFSAGERLEYQVRYGPISVGGAVMEVHGITQVRGQAALHASFRVSGGVRVYRVNDRYETWFDPRSFATLRFFQQLDQGDYERSRTFEIYPERRTFSEDGGAEQPSVEDPLDEASLIYYVRTLPLEVGRTYDLERYFRPDRNPVRVQVLRRERIRVPAGEFNTIVVRPIIKTRGIFSEGGRAEVWFTDDSTRTVVQIRSELRFGSLSLHLRRMRAGS